MSYSYTHTDILVTAQDLQDFAWSAPMRELAAKVALSDVGLRKLLKAHGVFPPPQGHWNKIHAGKPVPKRPTVRPRRPGETGRVRLDSRFAGILNVVEPMPSAGPFASPAVPEDLEELYRQELKAVGRVTAPRRVERFHRGLAKILEKEEQRRKKAAQSRWHWDEPKFDSAVDQRRLKLFNTLFMALSRRDQDASAYEREGKIEATAVIGNTRVDIDIMIAGTHRTVRMYGRDWPAKDLPVSTPLALVINGDRDRPGETYWRDDAAGKLEGKLAEITARIIVAGEERFRRGLREAEEREEKWRRWAEKQRQEAIERRNAERLKHLRESGDLLRQATDLRALIARVREAAALGSTGVDPAQLAAWEKWASAEADRLDPVLSGQILTHLRSHNEEG